MNLSQGSHVVATVHRLEDLKSLETSPVDLPPFDLLEFRLDSLLDHPGRVEQLASELAVPAIFTARHPSEGGACDLSDAERADLLRRFVPVAASIDVEIRSLVDEGIRDVAGAACESGVTVIGSFHDFEGFPEDSVLRDVLSRAHDSGAVDIPKIAVVTESLADVFRLATLVESEVACGRPVSAMGMGNYGKISRLVLAAAGSCLNYGYLLKSNAPGQWPAAELKRLIGELTTVE